MPTHPTDSIDRIAELETAVSELQVALAANRRRVGEGVQPRAVYKALTAEGGDWSTYPRSGCVLPITFVDPDPDSGQNPLVWTERTPEPRQTALAPCWFPPGLLVDVSWDGKQYQFTRWPTVLHGVALADITAAAWGSYCLLYTLGHGSIQIWRLQDDGTYQPQEYDDETPVLLTTKNTPTDPTAKNKFLTVELNSDWEWVVDIEPCGGACGS